MISFSSRFRGGRLARLRSFLLLLRVVDAWVRRVGGAVPSLGLWVVCVASAAEPSLTVVDQLGRSVGLAGPARRVVSLTPSNTETLFALGAGDRVVGVTKYCNFPKAATALPTIGGFAARTISVEAIVALAPDVVLAGDENQRPVIEALEQLGVPVVAIKVRGFDDLAAAIRLQGRVMGCEAQAEALNAETRRRVAAVVARAAQIPPEQRLRVYWEVFDEPLVSAGPRSIVGQLIALSGGINIFSEVAEDYPHISGEAVLRADPQLILGPTSMRNGSLSVERLRARPGWADVTAVRTGRVSAFADETVSRPGPRLAEGLEAIARHLYPAWFPAPTEAKP